MAHPQHLYLFRQGAETWNAWRATQPPGSVADLSGLVLENAVLTDYDLHGVHLHHALFLCCELRNIDFQEADLHSTRLVQCHLASANLRGANLRDAKFIEVTLREVNFHHAILTGADFADVIHYDETLS